MLVISIFSFLPQCFKEASSSGSLKVGIVWYRVKKNSNKRSFYGRREVTVIHIYHKTVRVPFLSPSDQQILPIQNVELYSMS